jgi:CheY-like chemotaxis protein
VLGASAPAPLVLLVDDSRDTRELYAEFFAYSGLRVALAVDGDHALWKVVLLKPDLVVMDLAMPVMDGWEAIRQIKTGPKTKHVPIIALTGQLPGESHERAREAGASLVLAKPCSPSELLAAVQGLLPRSST